MSNNSTIEQKAPVKKLTPNDLKIFMTTNLDLSELYKLKNICDDVKHAEAHTYNNLTAIDSILPRESEASTGILENVKVPILEQIVEEIRESYEQNEADIEEEAHDVITR